MNDKDHATEAPAAYNTRVAGSHEPDEPAPKGPTPLVSKIRGTANVITLIGGIAFAIGWAMHWPPYILGRVLLVTVTTFIISFISILIENRRHPEADDT